jgi:hypothetical protein
MNEYGNTPLRHRICALCDQPLENARKGHCAAIWLKHEDCFWVGALRLYQPTTALRVAAGTTDDWLAARTGT